MHLSPALRASRHFKRRAWAHTRLVHTHKFNAAFLCPNAANYEALTPLSLLDRAARLFSQRDAIVYETTSGKKVRRSWEATAGRSRQLADGLRGLGVQSGDTVSVIAPNTPAMVEAHFGVIGSGAVLHTINTRLDPSVVAFQLEHGESKVVLVDDESMPLVTDALASIEPRHWPTLIEIRDDQEPYEASSPAAAAATAAEVAASAAKPKRPQEPMTYEALLATGDPQAPLLRPDDENSAMALSYTSGTTGNPKGVVTSHRGAMLNALANCMQAPLPHRPVWLWVVPLFHCNGWCFPWSLAAMGGVNVCMRHVRGTKLLETMAAERVTHLGAAPVVMNMLLQTTAEEKARFRSRRQDAEEICMVTAGAAPPPSVMRSLLTQLGIRAVSAYGLTETFGPVTTNQWEDHYGPKPSAAEPAAFESDRHLTWQAHSPLMGDMVVASNSSSTAGGTAVAPVTTVPMDGTAVGEVLFRGNTVMLGYLKNEQATLEAFEGGWFRTGDLAVWHRGGRVELKDRSKDVIITGGENVSSIEVESALHTHPAVSAAAVVAIDDDYWGEVPCAVVELVPGYEGDASEEALIRHCREHLAKYKCPKRVLFEDLPKTSTGKVQKFQLRGSLRAAGVRGPGKAGVAGSS